MPKVSKIDSNVVGLRIAEEESIGVLPVTPIWNPQEPNSFSDFGGEISTKARNPINPSRQRKKGVVVGLEATGGYASDLTQSNIQNEMQGFMFSDFRKKSELAVATTDADSFQPASGGDAYSSGDILAAKGFTDSANNGRFVVGGTPISTNVDVTGSLVVSSGESGTISKVGFVFEDGDADIDVSGTLPALVSVSKDMTDFGLVVGEYLYLGGDSGGSRYSSDLNNGFCRVRSIAANKIEFDKTENVMIAGDSTGLNIEIYFGRVLKNESSPSLIKRRTYQLEMTLGVPDTDQPAQTQSQYVVGAVPNELTINIPQEDIVTVDLGFVGLDAEQRSGADGLKTGTRPNIVESDAFNTSSDITRTKISKIIDGNSAPEPLYAFAEDISININNGATQNKAVAVLGGFDVSVGTFEVGGDITAYFADIEATKAVRDNADVTLEIHMVKNNSGISIDIPLITLGDGKPTIEQDQSIKLPLNSEAASGAKIDANLDHTLLFVFWDYLPTAAG